MKDLRSHPHLYLFQHIEQMRLVARTIWARHSRALQERCGEVWGWIDTSITFHDAGKGSDPFQVYIVAPARYRGRKILKAHTPLSLLCVLAHGKAHGWDWRKWLSVASLAAGHHSELKTEDDLRGVCGTDEMLDVIEQQIATLDWDALDAALGIDLTRIRADEGVEIASDADDLIEALFVKLRDEPDRLSYRLRCQLAFSILLEADKAFLAIKAPDVPRYLGPAPVELPPAIVDDFLGSKPSTAVNALRVEARAAFLDGFASAGDTRLQTMSLPTGIGKTLLGATWALTYRERMGCDGSPPPKIVVVLPFLSIIDQTVKEYGDLLKSRLGTGDLISYHSLSERTFDPELGSESQDFFLDTWQSDVVITTFDQLLLALFSPKTKHQLRFHNLADAMIVLDEIQTVPCILWEPLRQALTGLVDLGSTHIMAMSATQPGFLPEARELIDEPDRFFGRMGRYRLVLNHRTDRRLSEFIADCLRRLRDWKDNRVLVTLNTRRCARRVFDALSAKSKAPVFLISGDRTPRDRLAAIRHIKEGKPCLVVSTQCVEAGVDIDMDFVIRDFAPFDSLIQIAGRCNRNGNRPRGNVEVVSLVDDESSRSFANQIYKDGVLLQATRGVLEGQDTIDEEQIYALNQQYFDRLRKEKNLGAEHAEDWVGWRETKSVRRLLRGDQPRQLAFVVVDQDPELVERLEAARNLPDRWERKRVFRALAPAIAQLTVSVYDKPGLDPSDFAESFPPDAVREDAWFWLLRPGIYDSDRGLDLGLESEEEPSWGALL